ncbi:hypothetical protein ABZ341_27800 [Streptomyces sp. NPDC006173]|uniref:hypothetical protein n=1 Tax=Streptomyces sp. NPDC006173 TaxID=3155349 RepID=UPI0033F25D70
MINIPTRLRISIAMVVIGLFCFIRSHFWGDSAHQDVHTLEIAAEFFLCAWLMGVIHYTVTSEAWQARKAKKRGRSDQSNT